MDPITTSPSSAERVRADILFGYTYRALTRSPPTFTFLSMAMSTKYGHRMWETELPVYLSGLKPIILYTFFLMRP